MSPELADLVDAAVAKREQHRHSWKTDAFRIFHGWTEGCPGVEVDQWGSVLTVDAKTAREREAERIAAHLRDSRSPSAIVLRIRKRDPELFCGDLADSIIVHEDGIRYWVEPRRPRNPGLYTDARDARTWLHANSSERRILNLFAFTGSLGIAAKLGGARSVVHIDSQRGCLERIKRNYQLNELQIDDRDTVRLNIYQHLRKKAARRQRYDGIIVDAPPYRPQSDRTPGERGVFAIAKHASSMLEPGGWMLCFFHHEREPRTVLEDRLLSSCSVPMEISWRGQSGDDYPEDSEVDKTRMTAVRRVS